MAILSIQNITHAFGERLLFENGSFHIEPREKVGFIGGNGVGKTTLFKIITGQLTPTGGQIVRGTDCTLGYMEQQALPDTDAPLYDAVLSVFEPLMEMERTMAELTAQIDRQDGDLEKLVARHHAVSEAYMNGGGLTYQSRCRAMLTGLGFTAAQQAGAVSVLSGGERTMAMLAKLLLSEPRLVLLDEPTNHLDIDACMWLEEYLRTYKGAAIIISHDRYFLDKVTNKTVELSGTRFTVYDGNYTVFAEKKAAEQEFVRRNYQNQMKEIKRIEGIIETQHRWNRERNIKMADSKQKQVDRMRAALVVPQSEQEGVSFALTPRRESGNDVLRGEGLCKSFDGRCLFRDATLQIFRHDRAFLLGPNGSGKTTLFRILRGELTPDSGAVTRGAHVETGSYDQIQSDLNPAKTVLDELRDTYPAESETALRSMLAAFHLRGEDVFKYIGDLSGGERAKVALTKVILSRPNFLLLDEPTNHLDIDAKEALETALLQYTGTILAISHDRYFINKLATKVLALDGDTLRTYDGNYEYYMAKRTDREQEAPIQTQPKKEADYWAEKERLATERRRAGKLKRLEADIAQHEADITALTTALENCGADYQKALDLSTQIDTLRTETDALYEAWMAEGKE